MNRPTKEIERGPSGGETVRVVAGRSAASGSMRSRTRRLLGESIVILALCSGAATPATSAQAAPAPNAALGGLVLRLEADTAVNTTGSTVTGWGDLSGHGNDLNAGGDPQLTLAGTPSGRPAISLDGSGDKLERSHASNPIDGLPVGNANRTMFIVAKYKGSSAWAGAAYGKGAPNQAFGLAVKSVTGELILQGWGGGNDLVSPASGIGAGWLVQSAVLNAGTATLYKNGVQVGQFAHNYNTTLTKLVIGGEIANLGFVNMDVAAVLIYDRALDAGERADVETYLTNKYVLPNAPPAVNIIAPPGGSTFNQGESIAFNATANDSDDGDLGASISWTSNLSGVLGSGASIATGALSPGAHTITASVTDSGGQAGSASIGVTINAAPAVTITGPSDGVTIVEGASTTFTAAASDAIDDDAALTGSINWNSDLGGPLGAGGSIMVETLALGNHLITASVTDSGGLSASASIAVTVVPNTAPSVGITGPGDGASFNEGASINFIAAASDAEDDDAALTAATTWISNLDGLLPGGPGGSITVSTLSPGAHTITASVVDSGGLPAADSIGLTINAAPEVAITAPFDGSLFNEGDAISFTGAASDLEDDDATLSAAIAWSSSIDGPIGNGVSFSIDTLSPGVHTITASVTDSGGMPGLAAISVTVGETPPPLSSDLVLRLEATQGVSTSGGAVTSWTDLSGQGNDVTAAGNPQLVPSATPSGRAAISLDGNGDKLERIHATNPLHGLPIGNANRTMFLVAKYDSSNAWAGASYGKGAPNQAFGLAVKSGSGQLVLQGWGSGNDLTSNASGIGAGWIVQSAVLNGGTATLFKNGAQIAQFTHAYNTVLSKLVIGEEIANFGFVNMDVAAMLIYNRALSAAERASVQAFLNTKFVAPNAPPAVTISSPAGGSTSTDGESVTFTASASDTQDGTLSASLTWRSDVDGSIGAGASVNVGTLSLGAHVITASVTDSGGLTGSASIAVTVLPNTPPSLTISAPGDGATFVGNATITFTATASDVEDDDATLTAAVNWTSNIGGALGTGASISLNDLPLGTHNITASVADSRGLPASASITVNLIPNTAPAIGIDAPADGETFNEGASISFAATASDAEDDDAALTATTTWSSDRDGTLPGAGGSISTATLSPGGHTITASATDSGGLTASDSVAITVNAAPALAINAPGEGSIFNVGAPIDFTAAASDAEDDDAALTAAITWSSDRDGPLPGAGESISIATLSPGAHTITASVTDSGGSTSTASLSITINGPPLVTIDSPADGAFFNLGDPAGFTATASDPLENETALTAAITWSSDRDGPLPGAGGSISVATLSPGPHTITASTVDSGGLTGSGSIGITINTGPQVTIGAPADGLTFNEGWPVEFTAAASDTEDDDTALTATITWSSDRDGLLPGAGGSISVATLSPGPHTITSSVSDGGGLTASDAVALTINAKPVVTITSPADASSFAESEPIVLTATAIDAEDEDETLRLAIAWSSNLDGPLPGAGVVILATFSPGIHLVTAAVTDSQGATGSQSITVGVDAFPIPFEHVVIDADNPKDAHCKTLGDIDGDGYVDGLAASSDDGGMYWYAYPDWTKNKIADGSWTTDMQVGDIDDDGDLDVIIPNAAGVQWYENPLPSDDPTGLWTAHLIGPADPDGASTHDVEVSDMDDDGDLDVVTRRKNGLGTYFWRQETPQTWTRIVVNTDPGEGSSLGDIDMDGDIDIAQNTFWMEQVDPVTWVKHDIDEANWPGEAGVFVADINRDGFNDIVIGPSESADGRLSWYESGTPKTGPWTEHIIDGTASYLHTFEVIDMDRDGDPDLVTAEMQNSDDPDEVSIYINLGDGLAWSQQVVATTGSHNIRVGDIDNDSDFDIFGANWKEDAPNSAIIEAWRNLTNPVLSLDHWVRHDIDPAMPWRSIVTIFNVDIDGDNLADIVAGGHWYKNPGAIEDTWVRNPIGDPMNVAVVHDFDGDGDPDVFGTEGSGFGSVLVWARNDGNGSFTTFQNVDSGPPESAFPNFVFLQGAIVNRFGPNGSGPLEIVLQWEDNVEGTQFVAVPDNPSLDQWAVRTVSPDTQGEQVQSFDLDGDGDRDLYLGTLWLRNDGASWTTFVVNPSTIGPDRIGLGDINRDGRIDAAVSNGIHDVQGRIVWFEQPATSPEDIWTEHVVHEPINGHPHNLNLVDMDLDGDLDIITGEFSFTNIANLEVWIFENANGLGTDWIQHTVFTGDRNHNGTQAFDFDGDGDLDISSTGWDSHKIFIYENKAIEGETAVVATPSIDPAGGSFEGAALVRLDVTTLGASIRYTINGQTPGMTSTLYAGPFQLTGNATVRARAYKAGREPSAVAAATFIVTPDTTPPSIEYASSDGTPGTIRVKFDEDVSPGTAEVAGNYAVDQGVSVLAVFLESDGRTVTLTTSALSAEADYTLTVNGVEDFYGNAVSNLAQAVLSGPPSIQFTRPSGNASVVLDSEMTISAGSLPGGEVIALLEILVDGLVIDSLANAQAITTSWTPLASGNHVVTARATNPAGVDTSTIQVFASETAAPFSADLVLHLDSRLGIGATGGTVASWADLSEFGNDVFAAGNPQLAPALTPSGLPAVSLDGNGDKLERLNATASLNGLPAGNANRTMFIVAKYNSGNAWAGAAYGKGALNQGFGLAVKPSSGELLLQGWGPGNDLVSTVGGIGAGWLVHSARLNGGTATLFKNGASIGQFAHNYNTVLSKLVIGEEIAGAGFNVMDVAAVLIYARSLDDTERAAVENYLRLNFFETPPALNISGPANGTTFVQGASIPFAAAATDLQDNNATLTASITWNSSIDGAIGLGGSLSLDSLSVGTHTIIASVTDSAGLSASANLSVTVIPNTVPAVLITAPENEALENEGASVNFTASANDAEDDEAILMAAIEWTSNIDGALGTGPSLSIDTLTPGAHSITAAVTDSGGLSASASISLTINEAPAVAITAPEDGSSFNLGTSVTLRAAATDAEDDDGTLTASVTWSSNLDNALGSGDSIPIETLTPGLHTITASVTDSGGLSASASIGLTINTAPAVAITAPTDDATFNEGATITFSGAATDDVDDDAALSASIAWSSDRDGPLGTGASISVTTLSPGAHSITAMVTDSGGLTSSASIGLTINAAPAVTITAPADGATFNAGSSVAFAGTASDAEDDDASLTAAIAWSSDLDNALGTGSAISVDTLSPGVHRITASVTDSGGLTISASIGLTINAAPALSISAPGDGTTFSVGTSITFTAAATDPEDDNAALTGSVTWTSNIDGGIGAGGSISFDSLSLGAHTVTASVIDSGGLTTSASISVTIVSNTVPGVSIGAPINGQSFADGTSIDFSATASDTEDNDATLTNSITWSSDLDGAIGTGGSISSSALSPGTHLITASVTDSGGLNASASITVHVTIPPLSAELVLHLDSTRGVGTSGGNVTSWADLSGRGNNVTASGNPQLVPALTPSGLPAISLDGNGDKLQRVHATNPLSGLPVGNANRTIFLVAKYNNSNAWAGAAYGKGALNQTFGLATKHPSGELLLQGWGGGNDLVSGAAGLGAGWLVQSATLNGGTATLYRNGVQIAQFIHNYNTVLTKLVIGEEIAGAGFNDMDVAAVLIYGRALNTAERLNVEIYLGEKYFSKTVLRATPQVIAWGHTPLGTSGGAMQLLLENIGTKIANITRLDFSLIAGAGHDFHATLGGSSYAGAHNTTGFDVAVSIPVGGTLAVPVEFLPTEAEDNEVSLDFSGNFPMVSIPLHAVGGGFETGDPFLHVVINTPAFVVDFDQNGSENVILEGSLSHTHEPGHDLTGFAWKEGGVSFSNQPNLTRSFPVGSHTVSLTITDDNAPPRTLTDSATFVVAAPDAVPGVFAFYYDANGGSPANLLTNLPSHPDLAFEIAEMRVDAPALPSNAMVRLFGELKIDTAGTYTFTLSGGNGTRLLIDGNTVSGPLSLGAGFHEIDARFALGANPPLPLEVLVAQGGGAPAPVDAHHLTHDLTAQPPVIDRLLPEAGSELGGNSIRIEGLGFFQPHEVVVHFGPVNLSGAALTVTPTAITLNSPPGSGIVQVSVDTPRGVTATLPFEYLPDGPLPIAFSLSNMLTNITDPTSVAWGPDERLYVGTQTGQIIACTVNDNYSVVATQTINTLTGLSNSTVLGIAFNPFEAANPPRIYVSHSQLYANGGQCFTGFSPYSGQISVLQGPGFNTVQPLITSLPVSNNDHAVNGIAFDRNGDLYVTVGGKTNAGVFSCLIGGLYESPLSGAVLRAEISKPGFNGQIVRRLLSNGQVNNDQAFGNQVYIDPAVDVGVYSPGARNAFDLVYTTRDQLFTVDNGPNSPFGAASTGPNTQGPGPTTDDQLHLAEFYQYLGHANRTRGVNDPRQNVFHPPSDATVPGVHQGPLVTFPPSTNGIFEYRASTFNNAMRGRLVAQQLNGQTFQIALGANGRSVASVLNLPVNMLSLDITSAPGGVIIGGDHERNKIVIAKPVETVTGMRVYDVHPWRAPATGGHPFVIGGAEFGSLGNTSVTIGGLAANLTSVTATRIRGTVPANPSPTGSLVDISVTSGGSTVVLREAFRYLKPPGNDPVGWLFENSIPAQLGESAGGVIGGTLYLVGDGNSNTYAYNPGTSAWSTRAARPFPGHHHAAEVINGKLYLFGGVNAWGKVQIFDPATNSWSLGADMPWPAGAASSAVIGGVAYVCGGVANNVTATTCAGYDPVLNTWTQRSAMPQGRNNAAGGTDGTRLYVFGGRGPGSGDNGAVATGFDSVQIFDPVANTWQSSGNPGSPLAPLPKARGGMGGTAVFAKGEFFIVGGETAAGGSGASPQLTYDRVDIYNPATNKWRSGPPMPVPMHGIDPVYDGSVIYVGGGGESSGGASRSNRFMSLGP